MTLYMYDAAYKPDLASVKANGGIAINGYLTGTYADTTTQPAQARAAGLGYVPTYEEARSELVLASRSYGQSVGRKILTAFAAKGLPLDGSVAVYPSVDVSVATASAASCNNAWLGIRDVVSDKVSLRAYAEGAVIDALASAGLLDGPAWLAAPKSWPGFNVNDVHVCAVQLVGSAVSGTDADHLITDPQKLGAYWPEGSPYGDTVTLTPAEAALLADAERFAAAADARAQALQGQVSQLLTAVADIDKRVAALQAAQASPVPGNYPATLTVGAKQ